MLKGLLLSGLVIVGWGVVQLAVFHIARPRSALRSMLTTFAPTLPIYLLTYLVTSLTLGVLPEPLASTPVPLGLLNGLMILGVLFLTSVQFYYHVNRAISLRILEAFDSAGGRCMSVEELDRLCGLRALVEERLGALATHRFVVRSGERYYLTTTGRIIAALGRAARRTLMLKAF